MKTPLTAEQEKFLLAFKELCMTHNSAIMVAQLVWIAEDGFLRVIGTADSVFPFSSVKELTDELAAVADKWATKATTELTNRHETN